MNHNVILSRYNLFNLPSNVICIMHFFPCCSPYNVKLKELNTCSTPYNTIKDMTTRRTSITDKCIDKLTNTGKLTKCIVILPICVHVCAIKSYYIKNLNILKNKIEIIIATGNTTVTIISFKGKNVTNINKIVAAITVADKTIGILNE